MSTPHKHLLLVRHAKSSWDDPGVQDFDRPLNQRGMADAILMSSKLSELPQYVLCSSALRTRQTAELLLKQAEDAPIAYRDDLYLADAHRLMYVLSQVDDSHSCVMLITHNPGVGDFATNYTDLQPNAIPTCCLLDLTYPMASWAELEHTEADTAQLFYPALFRN